MIPTLAWSWDNAYTTERTPLEDHYLHDVLSSLVLRPNYLTTLLSRRFVQPEYSLVTHSCLVYTAAGVSIEIHISLTLFTQVKCAECAWGRQSGGEIY